ncbi:hypothetical protein [Zoogloea sp.]|uniref:hypothetical protein n=1 Tax=Zoogloea sp. TaxID=49181 RepID=UPI0035B276D2
MKNPSFRFVLLMTAAAALATGCEQLGIPDPAKTNAQAEADGKAIGSACRHAGRAIEDCFTLNTAASKAAVFAGWKEMNDYMVENKIAEVVPQLPPPAPPIPASGKKKKAADHGNEEASKDKPLDAGADAHGADAKGEAEAGQEPEVRKRRRSRE